MRIEKQLVSTDVPSISWNMGLGQGVSTRYVLGLMALQRQPQTSQCDDWSGGMFSNLMRLSIMKSGICGLFDTNVVITVTKK